LKLYFQYPYYFVLLAAIVATGLTFLLYKNDKLFKDLARNIKFLLSGLRFLFIFIIILLLLNPIYKSTRKNFLKPLIVIAQDNSQSIILNKDSTFYKTEYLKKIHNLESELSKDFDVRFIKFDESVVNDTVIDYSGNITNISNVFKEIIAAYSGMNLGAVILLSDGIFNAGNNPLYSTLPAVPIYSVALGDTISQKDLIIKDVITNKIAFFGNRFPVRVLITADNCPENEATLTISRDNKIVAETKFQIPSEGQTATLDIEIPADKTGNNIYNVEVTKLNKEISYLNNIYNFNIKVIDNRQNILLITEAPHPDLGAIHFALKNNSDFNFEIAYANEFKEEISKYDLVILYQLPSIKNNITNILKEIQKNKISVLYILGINSSINDFNKLTTGVEIYSRTKSFEDATATYNNTFTSFDPGIESNYLKNLSPLKTFFGDYKIVDNVKILFYQNINGIKTQKPLFAFIDNIEYKTGIILGEGIWRWRMDDFKYNNSHNNFISLMNKTVQYLLVKKIANKLSLEYKTVYSENESVIINAFFYDETFELNPNLDVRLVLINDKNKEFNHIFVRRDKSYRVNLGRLPAGNYNIIAETKFDNKIYSEKGEFFVEKINIEYLNLKANHKLLNSISEKTGGKMYYPLNLNQLANDIRNNQNIVTLAYEQEKLNTISDFAWLFYVILLFAATEWALRKYHGGY
jgi:hypothetical protein